MPIGWQLIIRRVDDAVLAPGVDARRAFSSCVARVARGFPLVAFHAPDGHAHLPMLGSRAAAGQLSRKVLVGLGRVLGHAGAFEPGRLRPVHDQAHLRNLFRYTLDQQRHHGVTVDPFHEASALPDLLGLRVSGSWLREVVDERLPRVKRGMLTALLGVDPDELDEVDLACLADAGAAAIGRPSLDGRTSLVVTARAAAVQLARPDFPERSVAKALGCCRRTVCSLARHAVPPAIRAAVEGQWRLRTWVRGSQRSGGAQEPEGGLRPGGVDVP